MTREQWEKLPKTILIDCPYDMERTPPPGYLDATSFEDAQRDKAFFVKGLFPFEDSREPKADT